MTTRHHRSKLLVTGESLAPVDPAEFDPRKAADWTPIAFPDPDEPYPQDGDPYPPPPDLEAPRVTTSLTPASAQLGDPPFTLHVNGTGFVQTDTILWNGSPEPTTFVSDTELTTGVDMTTAQVAMPIPVSVRTFIGSVSNELTFDLLPAADPGTRARRS